MGIYGPEVGDAFELPRPRFQTRREITNKVRDKELDGVSLLNASQVMKNPSAAKEREDSPQDWSGNPWNIDYLFDHGLEGGVTQLLMELRQGCTRLSRRRWKMIWRAIIFSRSDLLKNKSLNRRDFI